MVAFLLLLAATTGAAAPAPSASSLPTIVHTVTSRSCSSLHDAIMPIGYVLKKNDEAFGGMSDRLQQIFSDFSNQGGAPTSQQLMQLGGSKYSPSGPDQPHKEYAGPSVDPGGGESNLLYSPPQVAKASQIDAIANAVYGNLNVASQVLDQSLAAVPSGTDAKTDEMRSRAQALMALQHSFADNYETFVKTYVNNQNSSWVTSSDQKAFVDAYMGALLAGKEVKDNSLPDSERTRVNAIADVVQNLHQGEQAYGAELISTYNQCNGTHIDANGSPAPNP
jgi:hypothetical protein